MKDAEWIATLLRAGLLQGSFIPAQGFHELRDLTRYRNSIVEELSSQKNRIERHLQSYGFKLSTFLTDIFGASGRAIINHLAEHRSITPTEVETYFKSRARSKLSDINLSVNGKLSVHQQEFLNILLKRLDETAGHLAYVEDNISVKLKEYAVQVEQLDGISGIDKTAAAAIIAELSTNVSKFKTAEHICSWAGLSPGNNESAGKKSPHVEPKGIHM